MEAGGRGRAGSLPATHTAQADERVSEGTTTGLWFHQHFKYIVRGHVHDIVQAISSAFSACLSDWCLIIYLSFLNPSHPVKSSPNFTHYDPCLTLTSLLQLSLSRNFLVNKGWGGAMGTLHELLPGKARILRGQGVLRSCCCCCW